MRTLYARPLDEYGTQYAAVVGNVTDVNGVQSQDGPQVCLTIQVSKGAKMVGFDTAYAFFVGKACDSLQKLFAGIKEKNAELEAFYAQQGKPQTVPLRQPIVVLGEMDSKTGIIAGEKFMLWNGIATDARLLNEAGDKQLTVYCGEVCRNIKKEVKTFKDGKAHHYYSLSLPVKVYTPQTGEKKVQFFNCSFFDDRALELKAHGANPGQFVAVIGTESTKTDKLSSDSRYVNGIAMVAC